MNQEQKERYIKGWRKRKKEKEKKIKHMSEQAMKKAKNISQILKDKYNIDEVILFGSLAENKFRENSDIDLAIVNSDNNNYLEIAKETYELAAPYKLDLLPIEKTPDSLKKNIRTRGIKL